MACCAFSTVPGPSEGISLFEFTGNSTTISTIEGFVLCAINSKISDNPMRFTIVVGNIAFQLQMPGGSCEHLRSFTSLKFRVDFDNLVMEKHTDFSW